jgi:L-fuculose-phosphate aldolase
LRLEKIGTVRSPWRRREQAPRQGAEAGATAVIEIEPVWREALEGIEPGRHLWVVCYLHQADEPRLRVHPRGDPSRPLTGLFNTRSPARPSPLGLCLVEVLAVEEGRLTVRGLDAIDGTPVVDLKPYLPGVDQPRRTP